MLSPSSPDRPLLKRARQEGSAQEAVGVEVRLEHLPMQAASYRQRHGFF